MTGYWRHSQRPSVRLSVTLCIVAVRVGVQQGLRLKLYQRVPSSHVPICPFRHVCCRIRIVWSQNAPKKVMKQEPCYRRDHRAMRPIYECPDNNVSAKSADDCVRISTLQSYHYSAVKLFSKYSIQCDRSRHLIVT